MKVALALVAFALLAGGLWYAHATGNPLVVLAGAGVAAAAARRESKRVADDERSAAETRRADARKRGALGSANAWLARRRP